MAIKGSKGADFRVVYIKSKNEQIATWNFFSGPDRRHQKSTDLR